MTSEIASPPERHLFEATGIEIEYMIVDRNTLDVVGLADKVLTEAAGELTDEVERGPLSWSNELALHVLELKTTGPVDSFDGLDRTLLEDLAHARDLLARHDATLLPSAMHPWMNPDTDTTLWPHGNLQIYRAFDRIFDCRGHGWSNLQSVHINLPFWGDEEFGRLHAAIRLVLPLLPGIAASSPFVDGTLARSLDARLEVYQGNSSRFPIVSGHIIPERVFTRNDYEREILTRIYDAMHALDREGILRHEWVNARGCIARFDRMAIEIRLLDSQECPQADLAVAFVVTELVRALVEEKMGTWEEQAAHDEVSLKRILDGAIRDAENTVVNDTEYLRTLGVNGRQVRLGDLWAQLIEKHVARRRGFGAWEDTINTVLTSGTLASRLVEGAGANPSPDQLLATYRQLERCLANGTMYR